ncbi:hypothetical protein EDB69_4055 [Vibrio crassostreae]|uniref:hypothetical protein n=1 Tax=Vibrio crassostreae TaxID=246167 RepID=UPI000F4D87FA|nr:hypothetical protein [Vibrio crassostreae]RPE87986.1 hypothetical protein EDB68_4132 [Vibrio crassostreae]RPF12347.1 hypothetical protein EDB69_4055 [Vibrio crassostreae]
MEALIEYLKPLADSNILTPMAAFGTSLVAFITIIVNVLSQYFLTKKQIKSATNLKDKELETAISLKDKELAASQNESKNTELKQKIELLIDSMYLYELALGEEIQKFDFYSRYKETKFDVKDETNHAQAALDRDIERITNFTVQTKQNATGHKIKASTLAHLYAQEVSALIDSISSQESLIVNELHQLRERMTLVERREKQGLGTYIKARVDFENTHQLVIGLQEKVGRDCEAIRAVLAMKVRSLG